MLSDREWNALREVECRLAAEDPTFVRTFAASQRRLVHNRPHRRAARIALLVAVLLGGLLLLAGSAAGALTVVVTTALVWLVWRACPEPRAGWEP